MRSLKLGIVLAILVFATSAFASTVGFTYGNGSTLTVAGNLAGSFDESTGVFTATSLISGVYIINNGFPQFYYPMTLVPTSNGGTGYSFDNLVYFPPTGPDSYGNQLDLYGLVFSVPGLGYVNLCATTGCANDSNNGYTNLSGFAGNTPVTAAFGEPVPAPTPEPSTLLMMGSGLIGLAGLARKRLFS